MVDVFYEFWEVFQKRFFIELLRMIVSGYRLKGIFDMTLTHFWLMFPFYTPWNGIFKSYKIVIWVRNGLIIHTVWCLDMSTSVKSIYLWILIKYFSCKKSRIHIFICTTVQFLKKWYQPFNTQCPQKGQTY